MDAQGLIPWPPSNNRYYRVFRGRVLLSSAGRRYRTDVVAAIGFCRPVVGRVCLALTIYPPDRRRRDLDNVLKAVCDGLAHARVYRDDSDIDVLVVRRGGVFPGGAIAFAAHPIHTDGCIYCRRYRADPPVRGIR